MVRLQERQRCMSVCYILATLAVCCSILGLTRSRFPELLTTRESQYMVAPSKSQQPSLSSSRIPNLLIAGTQKAGTTSTFHLLKPHPAFCHPEQEGYSKKEVHFFDHDKEYKQGLGSYQQRWEHCNNATYIMDATPNYILYPERVRQIYVEHGTADQIKIILSLREPVSREISCYNMNLRRLHGPKANNDPGTQDLVGRWRGKILSFEEYIQHMYGRPRLWSGASQLKPGLSLYGPLLKRWFSVFDRKQILVMSFDELRTNATAYAERIRTFLEIDSELQFPAEKSNFNVAPSNTSLIPPCEVQERVARIFERSNAELYGLLEGNAGPEMEQRPFPKFQFHCKTS